MNNKFVALLPLMALSIAFIAITLLVILTRGSNTSIIKQKLKIGAAIIMITGYFTTCTNTPVETCYVIAIEKIIYVHDIVDESLIVEYGPSMVISGGIEGYYGPNISYSIIDQEDSTIDSGYLAPKDGAFDSNVEFFRIEIANIQPGTYKLNFYEGGVEYQIPESIIYSPKLIIMEKKETEGSE